MMAAKKEVLELYQPVQTGRMELEKKLRIEKIHYLRHNRNMHLIYVLRSSHI